MADPRGLSTQIFNTGKIRDFGADITAGSAKREKQQALRQQAANKASDEFDVEDQELPSQYQEPFANLLVEYKKTQSAYADAVSTRSSNLPKLRQELKAKQQALTNFTTNAKAANNRINELVKVASDESYSQKQRQNAMEEMKRLDNPSANWSFSQDGYGLVQDGKDASSFWNTTNYVKPEKKIDYAEKTFKTNSKTGQFTKELPDGRVVLNKPMIDKNFEAKLRQGGAEISGLLAQAYEEEYGTKPKTEEELQEGIEDDEVDVVGTAKEMYKNYVASQMELNSNTTDSEEEERNKRLVYKKLRATNDTTQMEDGYGGLYEPIKLSEDKKGRKTRYDAFVTVGDGIDIRLLDKETQSDESEAKQGQVLNLYTKGDKIYADITYEDDVEDPAKEYGMKKQRVDKSDHELTAEQISDISMDLQLKPNENLLAFEKEINPVDFPENNIESENLTKQDAADTKNIESQGGVYNFISQGATKYNVDTQHALISAMLESSLGATSNNIYQIQPTTAKDLGVKDVNDPDQSLKGFAQYAENNRKIIKPKLKREPENWELYVAHQQGAGGFMKLKNNPNKLAKDVVGEEEVVGNGGKADMTSQEFLNMWKEKYNNVDLSEFGKSETKEEKSDVIENPSEEEYNNLPSGATFIYNGEEYTKE